MYFKYYLLEHCSWAAQGAQGQERWLESFVSPLMAEIHYGEDINW